MATEQHKPRRGRGGRQYDLRRVRTTDLAPGLRTVVSEFEAAVRAHEFKGAENPDLWADIDTYYDRRKQALIRKLLRIQNGDEYVDVELLKRALRRMSRLIEAIKMAPDHAKEIIAAAPESVKDTEKLIGTRRGW